MSKNLTLLPTGSIEAYTHAAYQVPMLTAEEERRLFDLTRFATVLLTQFLSRSVTPFSVLRSK